MARDFRETEMKELNQGMERIKDERKRKEEERKKKLWEQIRGNYQHFTGNSQLRGALASLPATDVIAAKLKQLRGKKEQQEPKDRRGALVGIFKLKGYLDEASSDCWTLQAPPAPAALRSHRDLLMSQVNDLQGKLTQVVKS
ncbi:Hypp8252 [Branchiostoma lanceolatum]|uniref:Hypp8252 protein n=1 Tax=Branchiostoma lanceolatum TaxID=7740 RepID=A0A8J9Z6D9_BRALA|nr:Hypp8252 [Branchiostoma lanceolatum]